MNVSCFRFYPFHPLYPCQFASAFRFYFAVRHSLFAIRHTAFRFCRCFCYSLQLAADSLPPFRFYFAVRHSLFAIRHSAFRFCRCFCHSLSSAFAFIPSIPSIPVNSLLPLLLLFLAACSLQLIRFPLFIHNSQFTIHHCFHRPNPAAFANRLTS